MSNALVYSLGLCAVSLALEGLCAGGGIRQRLAELRTSLYMPPLWGWIVIGLFYYVMCFAVLYRLFSLPPSTAWRNAGLGLVTALMLINAFWNFFFFRTQNLLHVFLIGLAYTAVAIALFCLLLRLDRTAALWLAPYLLYLCFANWWGHKVWKLIRCDDAVRREPGV